ncbi:thyroglobulin type-1 domain-containing protein [Caerostris darwini]|uniref:Thyroglobulin type-1 domain-containing protein n=1 Tax=Caerostris darwini TaxID=1538125 RepID=A0AAV4NT21_9ARAC|nr:thyroglobulin type-1 domain-containing protein [Caerostris darwini]
MRSFNLRYETQYEFMRTRVITHIRSRGYFTEKCERIHNACALGYVDAVQPFQLLNQVKFRSEKSTEMKLLFCFLIATSYCLVEILAKSECEENQKKALTRKEKWIPKCTESGKFEALQCYENTSECMCLRPDGTRVVEPSTKVKSCTCHIHKDNVDNKRLIGAWKPRCEEDGSYQKKQCSGSTGSCCCQGYSFFTIVFVFHSTQLNNEVLHPCPGGVLLLGGGLCPDRVPGEA